MMSEYVSMFDEEQKMMKRKERVSEYQRLLGRNDLPKIISGGILNVKNVNAIDVLKQGGYTDNNGRGWIRTFDKIYRYHAYILEGNRIEIHTDKLKKGSNGKRFHIASTYLVGEEKTRLRKFIPNQEEAKIKKKKYKSEVLSREKLLEALARIKENNNKNNEQ